MEKLDKIIRIWAIVVAWIMIIAMCCSCSTQYVPVETVRYDSVFLARIQKDSIFVQDSVFIKEKGDTVFVDKFKYIYRHIIKIDTVYVEHRDSIQVPYPVEKKLTRWQQLKINAGGYLLAVLMLIGLGYIIRWIIRKCRKRI